MAARSAAQCPMRGLLAGTHPLRGRMSLAHRPEARWKAMPRRG